MSWSAPPHWRESRCVRFRYRYSGCRRCADACPHDAIDVHDAGASLDPARCRHCALCVDACPTDAFATASYQPIPMLREAIRGTSWRVACAPSGATADAAIPCLGALGAVPMAYLARRGVALSLHGAWHCDACAHRDRGRPLLHEHLEAVDLLHDAVRRDGDAAWSLPAVASEPERQGWSFRRRTGTWQPPVGASRRRLLLGAVAPEAGAGDGSDRSDTGTAAGEPTVRAIRAGAYHVPEQRDLLQIVCRRAADEPVRVPANDHLPLMELELQPGCTVCEACFRACPTGAIGIDENPGDWTLTFDVDRCVGCAVCLEVCQPRVLDARPEIEAGRTGEPAPLLTMSKQRCARCDRYFVSALPQQHCAVCSDDEEAFAAIFG